MDSGRSLQRRVLALEVAPEDAATCMPDEVIRPAIAQCFHIAASERIERIADDLYLLIRAQLDARFCHGALL